LCSFSTPQAEAESTVAADAAPEELAATSGASETSNEASSSSSSSPPPYLPTVYAYADLKTINDITFYLRNADAFEEGDCPIISQTFSFGDYSYMNSTELSAMESNQLGIEFSSSTDEFTVFEDIIFCGYEDKCYKNPMTINYANVALPDSAGYANGKVYKAGFYFGHFCRSVSGFTSFTVKTDAGTSAEFITTCAEMTSGENRTYEVYFVGFESGLPIETVTIWSQNDTYIESLFSEPLVGGLCTAASQPEDPSCPGDEDCNVDIPSSAPVTPSPTVPTNPACANGMCGNVAPAKGIPPSLKETKTVKDKKDKKDKKGKDESSVNSVYYSEYYSSNGKKGSTVGAIDMDMVDGTEKAIKGSHSQRRLMGRTTSLAQVGDTRRV
jgi:hypothetical protein